MFISRSTAQSRQLLPYFALILRIENCILTFKDLTVRPRQLFEFSTQLSYSVICSTSTGVGDPSSLVRTSGTPSVSLIICKANTSGSHYQLTAIAKNMSPSYRASTATMDHHHHHQSLMASKVHRVSDFPQQQWLQLQQ